MAGWLLQDGFVAVEVFHTPLRQELHEVMGVVRQLTKTC